MAAKKKAKKRKVTRRNATRSRANRVPKVTVTGTVEALKDLAAKVAEIPGLIIKRVGF